MALAIGGCAWAATVGTVAAHEERGAGSYRMTVGWAEEPPYLGFANAVALRLTDATGASIADSALQVVVLFGQLSLGPTPMQPVPGSPGEYRLPLVPTRPGNYTFRFTGTVRGEPLDQSFTSSDRTFEPVLEPSAIQFPAKDPSSGQLAARLERMEGRTERLAAAAQSAAADARADARRATWLAAAGTGLGLLALGMAAMRGRKGR